MSAGRAQLLSRLGFRFGVNGPHGARTMMLDDLKVLFSHVPVDGTRTDYKRAVCAENILGKPTGKSRELALRHLTALYGLDMQLPLFRASPVCWQSPTPCAPC